jgi:lysyl-tRNA synthetase class 2
MPSSVIRRFDYDPEREELDVLFTTGRRYLYHRVPPAAADAFRAAFSKGRHFNAHIRDAYDYTECVG